MSMGRCWNDSRSPAPACRAEPAVGRGVAGRRRHQPSPARWHRAQSRPGCIHGRAPGDCHRPGHRPRAGPPAAAGLDAAGAGAARTGRETQLLSAIDARMGELYVARFERVDGLPVARDAERVCAPAVVALPEGLSVYGVGTGFAAAEGALVAQLGAGLRGFDATALPRASDVLTGGAGVRARRNHCTGEGRAGLPARQRGTDPGRAAGGARAKAKANG